MCVYVCVYACVSHVLLVYLFYYTATASYRLLPDITLTKHVTGKSAHRLKKCFPEGVIEITTEEGTINQSQCGNHSQPKQMNL